jgi:release factor glutamine methyltransferase
MNARAAAADVRARLESAGIDDAGFEAELLTRQASGLTRARFFAGACIDTEAQKKLAAMTDRRLQREPAAYISAHREFFGLEIEVRPGVLIPRPETELLVELSLEELRQAREGIVVDVGTGSGCVAVAIAANAPQARVIGTDVSSAALPIAGGNVERLAPGVSLVQSNLADAIRKADIVVANLPYIPTETVGSLEPEVRDWEPRLALDGGDDGLVLVRQLIDDCARRLRPQVLALEVMAGQAGAVSQYAQAVGAMPSTRQDLAGIDRVVVVRWR